MYNHYYYMHILLWVMFYYYQIHSSHWFQSSKSVKLKYVCIWIFLMQLEPPWRLDCVAQFCMAWIALVPIYTVSALGARWSSPLWLHVCSDVWEAVVWSCSPQPASHLNAQLNYLDKCQDGQCTHPFTTGAPIVVPNDEKPKNGLKMTVRVVEEARKAIIV